MSTDPNWQAACAWIVWHEGGYQNDPNDPGNWTGGAVGKGVNKGTNGGISAASYPNEDIPNLTWPEIFAIYATDWWLKYHFGLLPSPFSVKVFDISVNMGCGNASVDGGVSLLQRACNERGGGLKVDGVIGPITAAYVAAADPVLLMAAYQGLIAARYRQDAVSNPQYLAAWLARAAA